MVITHTLQMRWIRNLVENCRNGLECVIGILKELKQYKGQGKTGDKQLFKYFCSSNKNTLFLVFVLVPLTMLMNTEESLLKDIWHIPVMILKHQLGLRVFVSNLMAQDPSIADITSSPSPSLLRGGSLISSWLRTLKFWMAWVTPRREL